MTSTRLPQTNEIRNLYLYLLLSGLGLILFEIIMWFLYGQVGIATKLSEIVSGINLVVVGVVAAFGFAMTLSEERFRYSWLLLFVMLLCIPVLIGVIVQFALGMPVSDPRWEPVYTAYSVLVMSVIVEVWLLIHAYLLRKK